MGLGLLGALQGAGQSMTQFGNALFAEETERQRQAELQKIRDTDYKRGRADQLTDQQTVFNREDTMITQRNDREDAVIADNREYDAGLLDAANTLYGERLEAANKLDDDRYARNRDDEADIIMNVDVDANGVVYGITKGGTMTDIGDIAVEDPMVRNQLEAFSTMSRQIQYEQVYREDNPERFEGIDRLASQITTWLNAGTTELSYPQIEALGASLFSGDSQVDLDGNMVSGEQLRGLQEGYKASYPALYRLYTGQ